MYTGQIYLSGVAKTVAEAVALNLITVDGNGDIWLFADTARLVKVNGDLRLG